MAEPTAPESPEPAATEAEEPGPDPAGEEEPPLNRAARRARGKPAPGHVGPQPGRTAQGRGARSHTKRRSS